jgi:uncharacterized protein YgiB involved in biofilm formation
VDPAAAVALQQCGRGLDRWLPLESTRPHRLHAAQRSSVFGPGKRIRPALVYASLDECRTADVIPDAQCDAALAKAQEDAARTAPRYATREECEGQWGPSQCQPNNQGGGSFFTPLLAGFVIGQMLDGGRYYGGGPLYRDREDRYVNGYGGGYAYRDYRTGRMVTTRDNGDVVKQAPTRVQSRTTVVSRGGFGGGGRSFGG